VLASIYYVELAAVPFQLLFTSGFGIVAWTSIKHVLDARRPARNGNGAAGDEAPVHPEDAPKKATVTAH
jgi:hypothetical protein